MSARREARRREQALLDARARVLVEESQRTASAPARINSALAGITDAVNATMQTEASWHDTWADELAARDSLARHRAPTLPGPQHQPTGTPLCSTVAAAQGDRVERGVR